MYTDKCRIRNTWYHEDILNLYDFRQVCQLEYYKLEDVCAINQSELEQLTNHSAVIILLT